jgi:hypothetical protein
MAERAQAELYEAAAEAQVDVCRYRLVRHTGTGFGLFNVSKSLELFQDAVSFVYDAVTGRPKQRARMADRSRQESEMLFGYSYAGSLGVVLLAPSQRGLFITKFDDVVKTINQVFDIKNNDELRDAAKTIGSAAIHKIYAWAEVNHAAGYDLDLRWTNSNHIESGRYVEAVQFGKLVNLISVTSDVESTPVAVRGTLVGFDSKVGTFHFVEPDGDAYKGKLSNEFPGHHDWTVNKTYDAKITVEETVRYSTGETTTKYLLSALKLVLDPPLSS